MALIQYIGTKPHGRPDTAADTGIRWTAPGDVQEVPDEAVPKLLAQRDIWAPFDGPLNKTVDAPAKWPLELDGGEMLVLDDKDDVFLSAFAKTNDLKVNGKLKGDKLRAAVHVAALKAQATAQPTEK